MTDDKLTFFSSPFFFFNIYSVWVSVILGEIMPPATPKVVWLGFTDTYPAD